MDPTNISKKDLHMVNFYYDSVDVVNDIINKFVSGEATELNKKDLFNSEKLFMIGLNKVVLDDDGELGYALMKSFMDWSAGVKGSSTPYIYDSSIFLNVSKAAMKMARQLDFKSGRKSTSESGIQKSELFLQKNYFSKLRDFDTYDSNDISVAVMNALKEVGSFKENYGYIKNPNSVFAKIIEKKDVSAFGNLMLLFNYYYGDDPNDYSMVLDYATKQQILGLAKEADYGKKLARLDFENHLPQGINSLMVRRMALNAYVLMSKTKFHDESLDIAVESYESLLNIHNN